VFNSDEGKNASRCQAIQSAQLPLLYVSKEAAGLPLEIILKAFTVYLALCRLYVWQSINLLQLHLIKEIPHATLLEAAMEAVHLKQAIKEALKFL
jgi:hypothetical protein